MNTTDTLANLPPRPGVLPDDSLAEAGRKIMRYHFYEMLSHEEGTRRGEDAEELHDMRVATRRLRAAFAVFGPAFKPKALRRRLKELRLAGRALGRARDMDVLLEKARAFAHTLPEEMQPNFAPLCQAWQAEREQAHAALTSYLDGPDYCRFVEDFSTFVNSVGAGALPVDLLHPLPWQVRHLAPGMIYSHLASVRAYDAFIPQAPPEQLHALRIEFKYLRYTVEFFREPLGPEAKAVIDDLKTMQDHLGELNDAQVAIELLRLFLEEWEPRQVALPIAERHDPQPIIAYLGERYASRHQYSVTFIDAWARFNRPQFRQQLALAIAAL